MKAATTTSFWAISVDYISIHAAREGGDARALGEIFIPALFQSTPPVKAATVNAFGNKDGLYISIHAAREGGDDRQSRERRAKRYFNPRRP